MRISKLKLIVSSVILAGSIGVHSAFAHEGKDADMMSSDGMKGMMNMMSEMTPDDRKAMTKACIDMMQGHNMKDGDEAG